MKQAEYTRKGKQLINLTSGVVENFKRVNQAKRASRGIQMDADRALGRGTVRCLSRTQSERNKTNNSQLSQEAIQRIRQDK